MVAEIPDHNNERIVGVGEQKAIFERATLQDAESNNVAEHGLAHEQARWRESPRTPTPDAD